VEAEAHKTFRYKPVPTSEQAEALETVLTRCRGLYTVALAQRRTWWGCGQGKRATYYQQQAELPDLKAACPDYAGVNAQVLQDMLLRAARAFQAFLRRVQAGEAPGYTRFQGRIRYHSFTYAQYGGHGGAVLDGGILSLSRIGRIRIRLQRPLEGTPKTVTVSREADGWYACISCAEVPVKRLPPMGQETGIDLGLEAFATLAEGTCIANPRHYRRAEKRLAKAQRRVSRRKKGSTRRAKAVRLLAKAHQTVKRQRRDDHHKTALGLVRHDDVIYHEDVRVAHLLKNHQLATSIADAGRSQFLSILSDKAACVGRGVVAVDPAFTSQVCSGCGALVQKGLSVRWHTCPLCGLSLHQDHNSARMIHRRGQRLQGVAGLPAALNREAPCL
jgi:putative transposase